MLYFYLMSNLGLKNLPKFSKILKKVSKNKLNQRKFYFATLL